MIGFLCGKPVECQPTRLILDVNGVGYEIFIPLSTYDALRDAPSPVTLNTYLHVREDILQLFGFATQPEKMLFQKLISVSGIGPKVALGILSNSCVDDFESFIRTGDVIQLKGLPGIGKKTAERLILELKDKFDNAPLTDAGQRVSATEDKIKLDEAVLALVSLGYSRASIERVLQKIIKSGSANDVESLVKTALRHL